MRQVTSSLRFLTANIILRNGPCKQQSEPVSLAHPVKSTGCSWPTQIDSPNMCLAKKISFSLLIGINLIIYLQILTKDDKEDIDQHG